MSKTVKVKLLVEHRHADMQYSAGMELELAECDATWLKNLKIAEDVKASPAVTTAKNIEDKSS